jgi:inorganic phosphate transporter, PiT family
MTLLLGLGFFFGLYMAWNIGANDVANAMGTSVGSRALSLKQALIVAAIFELAGATMVGGAVTRTVGSGILDMERLQNPVLYSVVMVSALLAAALWLQFASWRGWPVSTTHAIVGAVAGGGVAATGFGGADWKTLGKIAGSWVLSPVVGGIIAFVLFRFISGWILNSRVSRFRVRLAAPWLSGFVVAVLVLALLYKGLQNLNLEIRFDRAMVGALMSGVAAGSLVALWMKFTSVARSCQNSAFRYVEGQFRWLQVLTACYVAFAHGANDVANAVGPLAGIWSAWKMGAVGHEVAVPPWILLAGGVGIVVGLGTWGYRVMETIGKRITELTPSRGFSAEFATATTVLVCSKLGIPISTTHTLVGSVIGVGFARGMAALDMRVVRDIFSAWVITLPVAFLLSAVICLSMARFIL